MLHRRNHFKGWTLVFANHTSCALMLLGYSRRASSRTSERKLALIEVRAAYSSINAQLEWFAKPDSAVLQMSASELSACVPVST
eukprot:6208215-Pleurochrysis_carterae.AAC.3